MDLLRQYSGSDDDGEPRLAHNGSHAQEPPSTSGRTLQDDREASPELLVLPSKSSAPVVSNTLVVRHQTGSADPGLRVIDPTKKSVSYNPTIDQLYAPVVGPAHPYAKDGLAHGARNHKQGVVEDAFIAPFNFDEQYNTYQTFGYAADPSAANGTLVGDQKMMESYDGATVYNLAPREQKKRKLEAAAARGEEEEGGEESGNVASETWLKAKSPWAGKKEYVQPELTEEQKKYAEEHAAKQKGKEKGDKPVTDDKSVFHGKEERDYQGRSWIEAPKDVKANNETCYIPKRWIHTWSGHTKGVSAIRFFPKSGHLLLSASMDTKIKIWDVHGSGKCMQTYMGHSKAVRDVTFNNSGTRFLSASYDRNIKLWDTETGAVLKTFSTGKVPYVVKFHPDEDKQNVVLAGMSDKKIVQWDSDTGEITQEYDEHLGAVNTITFVDDNKRFVTSSDDKSLRVWDWNIPVVIKYISEPTMHSMPAVTMHPDGKYFAAQSLDNQILIYGARDRFRLNRKKVFKGHLNAGYACQVNFSPDGRFVMSGDAEGRLFFWDWKTCKIFRTLKAHDQVTIGCEWHPLEASKVATCSWDGTIKYWD